MLSQPTPELPVPDVQTAQAWYRDRLGFEIAWYDAEGRIGAVAHGDCALLFREADGPVTGGTYWIFCDDLEAAQAACLCRGADITDPLEQKPWGLRQFPTGDPYGNRFHLFQDT